MKRPKKITKSELETIEGLWQYLESGSGSDETRVATVQVIEGMIGEPIKSKKWLLDKLASLRSSDEEI